MSATPTPVPVSDPVPYGIEHVDLEPGLAIDQLAERLLTLPEDVLGLKRRQVAVNGNLANVVYIVGEETSTPRFGMIVGIQLKPEEIVADADATVQRIQRERWGDPKDHNITAGNSGSPDTPAFREFWRIFPPGLFMIPNVPVYFLIFYRPLAEYAFMVVAVDPTIREGIAKALAGTITKTTEP